LVPKTRSLGAASVEFGLKGKQIDVDLLPTAPDDPLLAVHHCQQPDSNEVLLTHTAAASLSAVAGDEVVMLLSRRTEESRSETVRLPLKVKGILPPEATTIRAGYVQLPLLASVEEYRENLAVPQLGWDGPPSQYASPVFDGFVLLSDITIAPDTISRVSVSTGFLSHRRIGSDDSDPELARAGLGHGDAILFFNENDPRPASAYEAAPGITGSDRQKMLPWVKPLQIRVSTPNGGESHHRLHTLVAPVSGTHLANGEDTPWIALPDASAGQTQATLFRNSPVGLFQMPCRIVSSKSTHTGGPAYADASLTGILRHLDHRHLEWDPSHERFLLGRRSFSSFRLYADSLLSVSNVSAGLAAMGIDCFSESAKVARVLKFDKDLSILFWLVTAFSLVGGGAALALSLFGAIDRRRRDYAILRTLGLPRSWLVLVPLIEAITVAVSAFLVAMSIYHLNAAVINRLFSHFDDGRPGFCSLPFRLQVIVLLTSLALAVGSALAAAAKLLSISLAKAIRHA
jgi:putative ABC transport system permease protein